MEKTTVLGIVIAVLILIIYGIYYSVTTSPTDTSPTDTCSPTNLTGTCTSPMTCVQSGTNAGTCQNSYTCSSSSLTGTCPANQSCTNGVCGPATPVASCAYSFNQGPSNPTPANTAATCNSAYPYCNGYISNSYWGVCDSDCNNSDYTTGSCSNNMCVYSGCAAGEYMGNCITTHETYFTSKTPQDTTSGPNCCWSGVSSAQSCCSYTDSGCGSDPCSGGDC